MVDAEKLEDEIILGGSRSRARGQPRATGGASRIVPVSCDADVAKRDRIS